MRNYLFEINTQNACTLAEKYNLSEYDRDYIRQNFWPIIKVNNYDTKAIKEKLSTLKNEFIKDNTIFDLEIFNRENMDLLVYELNQYIDVLKRGKVEIWEEYGDDFFYIFKMESDIKENTLFISDKNITQVEIYFKNILGIITNHNESESLQKNDSKITDIQYKSYVKSIKDCILNKNKNSIESFKFEEIDPLKYLSKDKQLKKLNELINKFYELLNVGYPFVAYNFVNNVFDEENFFSNIPLSIMTNKEVLNIDEIEFNEEIKGFINDYARAKFLELLLSERELVLNPVNDPINFTNEHLAELEKIKTIKKSKKLNFDITDEVDDFEVFSKNFETEIATLFNQNISKNEKLNIYYKDYFPKYLSRVNNIVSQIEEMENDFKINFPELETDLKSLNAINSKFKKSILNDLETALNKILKIDYERLLFEYLNITNKLETDLKLEGKEISAFCKIFYNRMLHIKSNPKPREMVSEIQERKNIQQLPQLKDVFFVHYQCDDFEIGTKITSLSIYADDKTIEFFKDTEEENIEKYCTKVFELCNRGLVPIHWGQNKTYFGIEHIKSRYNELTGKTIALEYTNSINLGKWLINTYGERYISHPRLDNLANLNNFNGVTNKESRIFHTNRLFLLTKIYFNALNGTLKTEAEPFDFSDTSTVGKNIIIIKEKNSEMFSNNGFELFEYILNENVKPKETKGRKSDLIYYYWEMYNSTPQYIHQRPAPFFKWFDKEYNETTGQLKTYDNVKTPQRIKDYSTALEWFKSKNK
ncbi:hypothetical protein B0A81_06855 [Flavobacterium plurextorum]|uniref:Uncharacterized protein n=1 Tax=Flavobacterium plurextorum TaxID=1114867 RepID=A0ABX4CVX1_9FLAO|nr:hypothetical protein [Flavobacterium plurextorum]OXB08875.1 hypothetical protein B0A81_06855 [Flavobacterium plurextorum]